MNALDQAVLRVAARQHGALARVQAYRAGGSRGGCDRRLAAGAWLPTAHAGIYRLAGWEPSWHQRLIAAVLAGGDGSAASHRAAAVLHGVREGEPIELTVPPGAWNGLTGVVLVHRADVPAVDRTTVKGIPVTRVERTLVDLAGVVGDEACESAVEAALRAGLTSEERVRRRLEELAAPGPAGGQAAAARARAARRGAAGWERLEVRMIQLLRWAGLGDPVRQHEVRIGEERYFLDLAYAERGWRSSSTGRSTTASWRSSGTGGGRTPWYWRDGRSCGSRGPT